MDVFNEGAIPQEQSKVFFDLLEMDGYEGIFNPRPERYDETIEEHRRIKAEKGSVVIFEYTTFPLSGQGQTITRTCTNGSKEWRVIFESLLALWGVEAKQVGPMLKQHFHVSNGGSYVKRELVKIGSYTKKSTGEEKPLYSFKILEVYTDETEAIEAMEGQYGKQETSANDDIPTETVDNSAVAAFLPALVKMSINGNGTVDTEKLQGLFNGSEPTKHLKVTDEIVLAEIAKAEGSDADDLPF